jgi:hypothetical protein
MQIIRNLKGRARDKLIEKLQESKEKEIEKDRERSRSRPRRSYSLPNRGRQGSYCSLERGYSPDPTYMAPAREERRRDARPSSPRRSNGKLVKPQLRSKDNQGDRLDTGNRQPAATPPRGRRRGKSTKRSPARSSNDNVDQLSPPPVPPIPPKWTQEVLNNAPMNNGPQPARNNDPVARPNNRDPRPIVDRNGETFANRMRKQQAEQEVKNLEMAVQAQILKQIQESNKRKEAQIKADAEAAARLQQEEREKERREREAREKLKANAAADARPQNQEHERRARARAETAARSERERREREEAQRKDAAAKKNQESRLKAFGSNSNKPATQPRGEALPPRRNTASARPGPDPRARPKLTVPVPAPVPAPLTAANLEAQKDDHYLKHAKSELNRGLGDSARTIIPSMMTEEEYAEWEAKLKRENAERARRGLPPLE